MRQVWLGAALMMVALSRSCLAQDVDCANAETQMELTYCAEQDWLAADADLNTAYGAARDADAGH